MWKQVELSAGDARCVLGSLPAECAKLVVKGVFDTRTGKRTWAFVAQLDERALESIEAFRRRAGREAHVRLRAVLPDGHHPPFRRVQLDGCRLTLDGQALRLEDPDSTAGETWLWRPDSSVVP